MYVAPTHSNCGEYEINIETLLLEAEYRRDCGLRTEELEAVDERPKTERQSEGGV